MNKIYDALFKYGLHDTSISNLIIDNFSVSFQFNEGVYILDATNKETIKTDKIYLKIYVENFAEENIFQHLSCRFFKRGKILELGIDEFINKIKPLHNFIINVYYSEFNNELLIMGSLDGYDYEFIIENVERIEYNTAGSESEYL